MLKGGNKTIKGDPVALKGDGNGLKGNEEALKGNEEALKGNDEAFKGSEEVQGVKKRRECATGFAKRWRGTLNDYGTVLEGDEEALNNAKGQW